MSRARRERGTTLALALVVLFVVGVASGTLAQSLARRAHLARRQAELAAVEDLATAGRVLARARSRDRSWTGFDELQLAGGRLVLLRGPSGVVEMTVVPSITGRARRVALP
jgi:hypothetical protein